MEKVAPQKFPERCQRQSLLIKACPQMSLEQGENPERSQTKLDTNLSFYLLFKTSVGKNKQTVREAEPEKNCFSSFWLSSSEESENREIHGDELQKTTEISVQKNGSTCKL